MTAALGSMAVVGTVAAIALVILTTLLHRTTLVLGSAVEGLQVSESIEAKLIRHSRLSDPALQAPIEGEISSLLAQAHRMEIDDVERRLIDGAAGAIDRYFGAYHAARREGLGGGPAAARATEEFGAAFAAARRYIDRQVEQARDAQARATTWNGAADWAGVVAGLISLLSAGFWIVWIRSYAFDPMVRIDGAMKRFRGGDADSRARLEGPYEMQEIARRFNEMAEDLSHQQQRQLAFLAGVVHDLRNPLSALQLAAARLTPERGNPSDEQARSTVAIIRRQLDLLNRMTGDLLDAARIRSGQLELKRQARDLRDLVREALELFRDATSTHRLRLDAGAEPALVSCDPLRIEQVLNNLISNAIKYSPIGGEVVVEVERDADSAVVTVTDEGVGIAAEDLPGIFEPFRRAGVSREAVQGVGLGLFVARKIIDAHEGRITVESAPGQGSTFRVYLPLQSVRQARAPATPPHPEQPSAPPLGAGPEGRDGRPARRG